MTTSHIVGIIGVGVLGVIVVASIYQLGKKSNPIVPDATKLGTHALKTLFK